MLKQLRIWVSLLLAAALLVGCTPRYTDTTVTKPTANVIQTILDSADTSLGLDNDFLAWLEASFGTDAITELCSRLQKNDFTKEDWYALTGNTESVLRDMYSGALDKNSPNYRDDITVIDSDAENTTIRVVGDVSFADNWHIAPKIGENGLVDVMSEQTLALLQSADICLVNNEFTYSDRGKPLNKTYTFRAKPENVKYMQQLGADIVSLANNHAFDYGADAFFDTLTTLQNASLPYIGGGKDKSEAAKPQYFIVGGRKYAFSAATRAEKNIKTPEAGENTPGVMRTYDATEYLNTIRKAEQQCDYNIVYVHWGAEGSHHIEDGLYEMGASYIDAGADIVIGSHAHVLQGIRYYSGVPIVFNLGNFLFNAYTMDTGVLEIVIDKSGVPTYRFIPAKQRACKVSLADSDEKKRILSFMESLSTNVAFDENGVFTEKAE